MPSGPTKFRTTVVKPFQEEEVPQDSTQEKQENNIEKRIRTTTPIVIIPAYNPRQEEANFTSEKKGETKNKGRPSFGQENPIFQDDSHTGLGVRKDINTLPRARNKEQDKGSQLAGKTGSGNKFVRSKEMRVITVNRKEPSSVQRKNSEIEMFLTRKEQEDIELAKELRHQGKITTPGEPFQESQQREIDSLIANGVFEFVRYDPEVHTGRIFNSRLVNEVKGKGTDIPYEKSRLVIQAYNDLGKEVILTQSPTIQRASQRVILALAPALLQQGMTLSSRDISQAYTQATSFLVRRILAYPPKEIKDTFPLGTIMIVRKPLYGVPEAGTHWWATYNKHHKVELKMETSSYDPCLLITTTREAFAIVGMQTDDTLILGNKEFTQREEEAIKKAKFIAKPVETLTYETPLIFNGGILRRDKERITMTQKGQGNKIQLIDLKSEARTNE
jgi:hypothetical protein